MTVSRASAAFLGALLLASLPAAAQTGGTVEGRPSVTSEPLGPPTSLLPFDPSSRQGGAEAEPGVEAVPQVQGIAIDRLDSRDPNAIGLYEPAKAGLGRALWQGSRRSALTGLLSSLPAEPDSRVLRALQARLLLVSAEPPRSAEEQDLDWLTLRIERLLAMGEVEELGRMLTAVPRHLDNEPIQRARVETALLNGDLDGGCREIRSGVAAHPEPWWQRALVICQAVSGERAQAQLGMELLRERGLAGPEADPQAGAETEGFEALYEALMSAEAEPEVPVEALARPLGLAALRAKGLTADERLLAAAEPPLLLALARSERTPNELRIEAAETGGATGLVPPKLLDEAYHGFAFGQEQLLGELELGPGPSQRALLYQRVLARKDPAGKAAAIVRALERAEAAGAYRAVVEALLPQFAELPVDPSLAFAAEPVARALYVSGSFERAEAWYALARDESVRNSAASAAMPRLAVYSRLAGGIALTLQEKGGLSTPLYAEPADLRGAQMLRGFFEALEKKSAAKLTRAAVGETDGDALAGGEAARAELIEVGLAAAANDRAGGYRQGEVLLRALNLIGEAPLEDAPAEDLVAVVAALERAGLGLEARSLAIEASLASGI